MPLWASELPANDDRYMIKHREPKATSRWIGVALVLLLVGSGLVAITRLELRKRETAHFSDDADIRKVLSDLGVDLEMFKHVRFRSMVMDKYVTGHIKAVATADGDVEFKVVEKMSGCSYASYAADRYISETLPGFFVSDGTYAMGYDNVPRGTISYYANERQPRQCLVFLELQ